LKDKNRSSPQHLKMFLIVFFPAAYAYSVLKLTINNTRAPNTNIISIATSMFTSHDTHPKQSRDVCNLYNFK